MEEAELLVDYASSKAGVDTKQDSKLISDECKEKVVEIMDIFLEGFKEKHEESIKDNEK